MHNASGVLFQHFKTVGFIAVVVVSWLQPLFSYSQITVSSGVSSSLLAQKLMGNSVKVDSAYVNCDSEAYGIFRANGVVNLPFQEGVLLTTGNAPAVARPANNNLHPGLMDFNLSTPGSPFIQALTNQTTEDACELKLFVKPMGNRLQVDYLFGSEEYPEQVNKFYYDAFVFLVKGARPTGGFYNDTNIAKINNGNPVTVATINNGPNNAGPCTNCQLYRDNSTNPFLGYDGITTPLIAGIEVVPCTNYELTLIIADVRDGKYDSGVFLKMGAVNSNGQAAVNVAEAQICRGQSVNLNVQSNVVQNFSWSTGQEASDILVSPTATTQYTCFYDYCGVSGYQTVTVRVDTLSPATTYSYGSSILCKGDSLARPILANGNGVFYSTNPALLVLPNGTINLSQTPAGDYPLTFSVTQGLCPATYTKVISVRSSPELTVSGGQDYCSNQPPNPIELNALGLLPFRFKFLKDGQESDTTVYSNRLTINLGKGIYSGFEVKDGHQCKAVWASVINQKELEAPTSNFLIQQTDSCQNSGLRLQNLSSIERATISEYYWYLGDSLISSLSDLSLPKIEHGFFTIRLISKADNGCTDTLTKNGFAKPSPEVRFNYTSPCYADTVKLFNQSSSPLGSWIQEQKWMLNNIAFNGNSWVAYDSIYTLKLKVINNLGCSDSLVKVIRTIPNPKPSFTFTNVCEGDTFNFVNTTTNVSGNALTYTWDLKNDGTIDFVSKDCRFKGSTPGKFWVKLNCVDDKGCKANLLQLAEVYPLPVSSFLITDSSGCSPFSLKVHNTGSVADGFFLATSRWILNGQIISNEKNLDVKLITPGKYVLGLEVSTNRNCSSKIFSDSVLQVFAADKPNFQIFPSDISLLDNKIQVDFLRKRNKHWLIYNGETLSSFSGLINFEVRDSGWQKLTLVEQNQFGCLDTVNTEIYVKSDYAAYLPNTFTPNTDGLNEQFCLTYFGISEKDFLFRIMNRNNEEVFVTTDPNDCWDGRDKNGQKVMQGIYIYEVKLRTLKRVEKNLKGTVLLLR